MVVDEVTVRALTSLPEGIDRLLRTSLDEVLVEARVGDRLVGVGGLNRDPYVDDSRVGRIRHLYASPEVRGRGVGRKIVVALVDHARGDFSRVRLRTTTEDAARFYTELGFQVADEPDATHVLGL